MEKDNNLEFFKKKENINFEARKMAENGNQEGLKKLFKEKTPSQIVAIVNSQGIESRKTTLHWACQKNNLSMVIFLLAHGADPLAKDKQGKIPSNLTNNEEIKAYLKKNIEELIFRKAATNGDQILAENILKEKTPDEIKAIVNSSEPNSGDTSLHLACKNGHLLMVRFLIQNKATFKKNYAQEVPYDVTNDGKIKEYLLSLFRGSAESEELTDEEKKYYGFSCSLETLKKIAAFDPTLDPITFNNIIYNALGKPLYLHGIPPLTFFVNMDQNSLKNGKIKYLLQKGHDPNLTAPPLQNTLDGGSVFHSLLYSKNSPFNGQKKAIELLGLVYKWSKIPLKPAIQNIKGETIIIVAVLENAYSFLFTLFKNVDTEVINEAINIPDNKGKTPLDYAVLSNNSNMIQLLKSYDAVESSMNQNEAKQEEKNEQEDQEEAETTVMKLN